MTEASKQRMKKVSCYLKEPFRDIYEGAYQAGMRDPDSNSDKIAKLEAENKRLKDAFSTEKILEIIEEWQMYWCNQNINPEDTKRYRRRALSVDANMRHSLAKRINKALSSGGE